MAGRVPVAAHRLTAEALTGTIRVDRLIEDGETIELEGEPRLALRALHTPGHARGHLCFYEEQTGALITGDNIVGLGSVLIDPPEGNMRDYLQLARTPASVAASDGALRRARPGDRQPRAKIDEYIAHRLEREAKHSRGGARRAQATPEKSSRASTRTFIPKALPMAERAVLAHLEKLETIIW